MNKNINEYINKNEDKIIKDIQRICRIKSVRDTENRSQGAPFGPGIRKTLEEFCLICEENGFETYLDPEGYYAYAEIGPDTEEMIGIIGHLDVVPEGDESQWTIAKPYSGDIVDNCLYARGSVDDKGPVIINIYALKSLVDNNIKLNKKVRIIVGSAEETTWEGINKYKEKEKSPTISYSPDSDFPLIYAEKTIIRADIIGKGQEEFNISSEGAYNAVNDHITYTGPKYQEIGETLDVNTQLVKDKLEVSGKSAHSMEAFKGINAGLNLVSEMKNNDISSPLVNFLSEQIGKDPINTILFKVVEDDITGKMTTNIGFINSNENEEICGIDIRIPVKVDDEQIVNKLKESVESYGLELKLAKKSEKLYVSKESDLIKKLLKAYELFNEKEEPSTSGGGTYARAFDNCVAFGAVLSKKGMTSAVHQPNECFQLKYLNEITKIYAHAILELNKD